jgi:hypothetical protein
MSHSAALSSDNALWTWGSNDQAGPSIQIQFKQGTITVRTCCSAVLQGQLGGGMLPDLPVLFLAAGETWADSEARPQGRASQPRPDSRAHCHFSRGRLLDWL